MFKPSENDEHHTATLQEAAAPANDKRKKSGAKESQNPSRRAFLRGAGGLTVVSMAAAAIPLEPLLRESRSKAEAAVISYNDVTRASGSLSYRQTTAQNEDIDLGVLPDNGDAAAFSDHSGTWSKVLPHPNLGIVDNTAYGTFIDALTTGKFADFQAIQVGNPGGSNHNSTLNGPQGALAFDLEGLDSHATDIPPAPSVTSAQTAAEEVEHYWGALLRDTAFSDYETSLLAAEAVSELNSLSYIKGGSNTEYPFPVEPQNLFRGQIVPGDGNVQGPYLSQFLLQPTFLGVQQLSQKLQTFAPKQNFMTSVAEYQSVESGFAPSFSLVFDKYFKYLHAGRDLAAYTHVDALYQAYLVAALVLSGIKAPLNPGNPYIGSRSENGFGTLGGPDIVGTLAEMATRALKAAWFHKWIKDLRLRPEEYGGLVQARLTGTTPVPQAAAALHPDVLNSAVLPLIHSTYGSFLLPQAFPEGSPTHPCYPTGHGTVGGACITALKFFFDCSQKIRPLLNAAGTDVVVPSDDGLSLLPYTGTDRDSLDINGELNKLAFNISFGHGIHAGIHFRSSTFWSIKLGEQLALSILKDRARSYNEPFTISITKFDGTTATITNQGNP